MPTSLQSTSPEYRAIVAANTAIIAVFTIELNATGRSLALKIGGSTVLSWDGTTTTVASGYSGSVTLSETTLTVTLTKTGGWTHATGVVWSVSYTDSVTNSIQRDGAHIYLTETLETATPPSGSRDVARRPWVLTEASASAGTVVGMDLQMNGENAIEGGVVNSPDYEGFTGVSGTKGYAIARPRRFYQYGQSVDIRARLRVSVSSVVYRGSLSRTVVVGERPLRIGPLADITPSTHPLLEAARRLMDGALRPAADGPNLGSVLPYYIRRTEIGGLARWYAENTPDPTGVDLPSYPALVALVTDLRPLAAPLFNECAHPADLDSLLSAWRSESVLEQVGALCVLLVSHR